MAYTFRASLEDMFGSWGDPIIVFPGGWGDTLPARLRSEIEIQRMVQVMESARADKRPEIATDAEALAYLYTTSFIAPMPSDLARIYLWLGARILGELKKEAAPFVPDQLTPDEEEILRRLKEWLWGRRLAARGRGHRRLEEKA